MIQLRILYTEDSEDGEAQEIIERLKEALGDRYLITVSKRYENNRDGKGGRYYLDLKPLCNQYSPEARS